jgi:DNA-binding NarL/FixJ family response regulator
MSDPTAAASAPLRALVVDADDRIRESLTRLLPIGGRVVVVGSAGQCDLAVDLAGAMTPDVVVIDSRTPDNSPDLTFVERLRSVVPGIRVVVLSLPDGDPNQGSLPGADAYIRKTFRPQELIDAVVNAARRTVA